MVCMLEVPGQPQAPLLSIPGKQTCLHVELSPGLAVHSVIDNHQLSLQALRWENAPVITDFDPRFNNKRLMFFERFYQPFLGKNQRIQEEPIYDK